MLSTLIGTTHIYYTCTVVSGEHHIVSLHLSYQVSMGHFQYVTKDARNHLCIQTGTRTYISSYNNVGSVLRNSSPGVGRLLCALYYCVSETHGDVIRSPQGKRRCALPGSVESILVYVTKLFLEFCSWQFAR